MIKGNKDVQNAFLLGQTSTYSFRKVPGLASTAYWWSDLGMAAGQPMPNYYASTPLTAATLSKWDGICHGDDKSPAQTAISEFMICGNSANDVGRYMLLDYLLYYPFVDGDSTDQQDMINTVTLPRYTSGDGVRVMMVSQAPSTGSGVFTFRYINQSGVEKTSPANSVSTGSAGMGAILNSQPAVASSPGPFLILAEGDTGVRQILSVKFTSINGGLSALVLVKPITDIALLEINAPNEKGFFYPNAQMPVIEDGAFLGLIACTAGSVAATIITGWIKYIWN